MIIIVGYNKTSLEEVLRILETSKEEQKLALVKYTYPPAIVKTKLLPFNEEISSELSMVVDFETCGVDDEDCISMEEHQNNLEKIMSEVQELWDKLDFQEYLDNNNGEFYVDNTLSKTARLGVFNYMKRADMFAERNSTDPKVYVGAVLGKFEGDAFLPKSFGCNANESFNEREMGQTYREFMFNSRDKKYRPWDRIIHAEENAIYNAMQEGVMEECDTAIVTRYPCEKCAQLMVHKGIKNVYYGRPFEITEGTKQIFQKAGVNVVWIKEYLGDTSDDNK